MRKIVFGAVALAACARDEGAGARGVPSGVSSAVARASSKTSEAAVEASPSTEVLPREASHVAGKNFAIDLASSGCNAGAACVMTIRLVAEGAYHVNDQYPHKFIAKSTDGDVVYLGKGSPPTFSRDTGDFTQQGEKAATLKVRFEPKAKGTARIAGTFKLSVCSADQCQIEAQELALEVPVN